MSQSFPDHVKKWVSDCLSLATPSNKAKVSAELRTILFEAHRDGTMDTTDWTKVEIKALKSTLPKTMIPPVTRPQQPPPPPPATYASVVAPTNGTALGGHSLNASASSSKPAKAEGKKRKREKEKFPTAYYFESENSEESAALARRAARFSKAAPEPAGAHAQPAMGQWFGDDEVAPSRFGLNRGLAGRLGIGIGADANVLDWDYQTIKGTSTRLEKSYLRLTSDPSPADIRPLHVLKQTLVLLKGKWKENHNYAYALDQFKSMRQDLTVQRIKNEFTVEVYEIHARIALEAKDLGEYNQCQSMLRQLYELGIKGHPQEFLSYRIIYLLHTKNRSDMASLLAQLTPDEKADPGIHHALQVAASLATSNYVVFFRLFLSAPNMSGYIMDHFVERERMSALAVMSKSYMTLALPYLTKTLAFDDDAETDRFLADHDAAIYTNPTEGRPAWKPKPTPLDQRVWDAKKAQHACKAGLSKYRVVDLKGQVD